MMSLWQRTESMPQCSDREKENANKHSLFLPIRIILYVELPRWV